MGVTTSTTNAGVTYVPIATNTLSSSASSVTFSSIPSTYTDLVLVMGAGSTSADNNCLQVGNGSLDTSSNYSDTMLYGNGSSAYSSRESGSGQITLGGFDGGNFGTTIIHFLNYSNTTTYKTTLNRTSSTNYVQARVGLWRSTSAINILKIYPSSSNFSSGSTFTLYGIRGA